MFGGRKAALVAAVIGAPLVGLVAVPTLVEAAISNPQPVTQVRMTIDGYEIAQFSRCIGLGSESEVEAAPQSEGEVIFKRLPGATTGRTVCERAVTSNLELATWRDAVLLGDMQMAAKDATITMYASTGDPQLRWHLTKAWPSGLTYLFEDGLGREVVTFTYDSTQRVAP